MRSIVDRLLGFLRAVRHSRGPRRARRPRRGIDGREAVADALAAVRDRREARLRAALDGRLEGSMRECAGSGEGTRAAAELLILGRGCVEVPSGETATPADRGHRAAAPSIQLADAPLVVRAAHGVEVQAPPPLARIIADAYRHQLDVRYGPAVRERVHVSPGAGAAPIPSAPDPLRARVWIAPDGRAFARTPLEARGQWVPLEIRL